MDALADLQRRAGADDAVRGLVLTGSHARGLATDSSDYDVFVVVDARCGEWTHTRRSAALDEIIYTVDELADLRWELTNHPLGAPWDAGTLPERLLDDPAGLFPDLERLARGSGLGDVLDGWGDDLALLRGPDPLSGR